MVETELQNKVEDTVLECIVKAEQHYNKTIDIIPIKYKNMGRTAGRFSYNRVMSRKSLAFSPTLLSENGENFINRTVPHEVAHYIVYIFYPMAKPHGREWRFVMNMVLKAKDSKRCHKYDVSNVKRDRRTLRKYIYHCNCDEYQVSSIRHNRMQRYGTTYICKKCKGHLTYFKSA
jgi:SprT protein